MAKDKFNPEEWLNQPTDNNKAVIPGSTGDLTPNVIPDPDRASNDIETITQRIEARCLDITAGYDNWRDLGFALSEELGETGRDYYHRISRFNPDYDQAETNRSNPFCSLNLPTVIIRFLSNVNLFFYEKGSFFAF